MSFPVNGSFYPSRPVAASMLATPAAATTPAVTGTAGNAGQTSDPMSSLYDLTGGSPNGDVTGTLTQILSLMMTMLNTLMGGGSQAGPPADTGNNPYGTPSATPSDSSSGSGSPGAAENGGGFHGSSSGGGSCQGHGGGGNAGNAGQSGNPGGSADNGNYSGPGGTSGEYGQNNRYNGGGDYGPPRGGTPTPGGGYTPPTPSAGDAPQPTPASGEYPQPTPTAGGVPQPTPSGTYGGTPQGTPTPSGGQATPTGSSATTGAVNGGGPKQLVLKNNDNKPMQVGLFENTGPGMNPDIDNPQHVYTIQPGQQVTLSMPSSWQGRAQKLTGKANDPATWAELNFENKNGVDKTWYDESLIRGYNGALTIKDGNGGNVAGTNKPILNGAPAGAVKTDSGGNKVIDATEGYDGGVNTAAEGYFNQAVGNNNAYVRNWDNNAVRTSDSNTLVVDFYGT